MTPGDRRVVVVTDGAAGIGATIAEAPGSEGGVRGHDELGGLPRRRRTHHRLGGAALASNVSVTGEGAVAELFA